MTSATETSATLDNTNPARSTESTGTVKEGRRPWIVAAVTLIVLGGSAVCVFLPLVPEAIAFALVAHVSPLTGLYAAVLVSFITSAFGGRPGMISGAAGALAVVMVALAVRHGAQYLFAAIVLMGVLQMLFAAARLGKFIRMVPHPVMLGFVNGLAIVIFVAQF